LKASLSRVRLAPQKYGANSRVTPSEMSGLRHVPRGYKSQMNNRVPLVLYVGLSALSVMALAAALFIEW